MYCNVCGSEPPEARMKMCGTASASRWTLPYIGIDPLRVDVNRHLCATALEVVSDDLITIQERIFEVGADFASMTEVMDTRSPVGRMIFSMLGAFAEFERELIRERSRVGLHAAMARAVKPGHPRGMNAEQDTEAMKP